MKRTITASGWCLRFENKCTLSKRRSFVLQGLSECSTWEKERKKKLKLHIHSLLRFLLNSQPITQGKYYFQCEMWLGSGGDFFNGTWSRLKCLSDDRDGACWEIDDIYGHTHLCSPAPSRPSSDPHHQHIRQREMLNACGEGDGREEK